MISIWNTGKYLSCFRELEVILTEGQCDLVSWKPAPQTVMTCRCWMTHQGPHIDAIFVHKSELSSKLWAQTFSPSKSNWFSVKGLNRGRWTSFSLLLKMFHLPSRRLCQRIDEAFRVEGETSSRTKKNSSCLDSSLWGLPRPTWLSLHLRTGLVSFVWGWAEKLSKFPLLSVNQFLTQTVTDPTAHIYSVGFLYFCFK